MQLVIVESPTKARTIEKFLGKDYTIRASMGHIMDLPKSNLGIDIENNFAPQYEVVKDKQKIIAELQKLAKNAQEVILATDPDREGEAISSHIYDVLHKANSKQKFSRIVFHEITKEAIMHALNNPGEINVNLVNAQTGRRILDRLVGYKLSPLLWRKVRRGLSAGRVQSVALRLIVEREKEINLFQKEEYFTIAVTLLPQDKSVPILFEVVEIDNKKIETTKELTLYAGKYRVTQTILHTETETQDIVKDIQTKEFIIQDIISKESKRTPPPPLTTSTLQQEAARRLGFSGKKTMTIAQKLYEEGYITYHRTDSLNISQGAIIDIRQYIKTTYGEQYQSIEPRIYKAKQKLAQEAHEAIRPTKINTSSSFIQDNIGRDYAKLYEIVWRRALASQMAEARIETTTIIVHAIKGISAKTYVLRAGGSVLLFDGFLKVYQSPMEDKKLPQLSKNSLLNMEKVFAEKHETPAPPRYNDASLIAILEEEGIGRPSTYATIIGTIQSRLYIEKKEKKFVPTPVGIAVTEFLVKNFPTIDDIPFTAGIEDDLDTIAKGEEQWEPLIRKFYTPFAKQVELVAKAERVKIAVEETGEKCPLCESALVIRTGRFGRFIACSNFPTCTYKKQLVEETQYLCPNDQAKIIVKKTKRGRSFYGCSNYPKCTFAVWKLQELTEKK